jgi:DNA-binding NarL/FixJ family response regulator
MRSGVHEGRQLAAGVVPIRNLSHGEVTLVAHILYFGSYNEPSSSVFPEDLMKSMSFASLSVIRVLVADSNRMECQLLVSALRQRPEFDLTCCAADIDAIRQAVLAFPAQVAIINVNHPRNESRDMTSVRRFHLAHPEIPKIVLINSGERDVALNAFRSGARGLFCFADYPFGLLCKCIQSVHLGQVWANSEQLQYLIEAVAQVPSLRVVNASGLKLLTPREEQVVALVADGLSNREIAQELGLSEHTVKKYLFRIFDKLGISSRVELVLYAFSHGGAREAEWVAGASA